MIDPPGRWKIFPPLIGIVIQAAYSCWIFQANGRTQNRRKRQDDRPVRRLHRVGRPKKHKTPKFRHPSSTGAGVIKRQSGLLSSRLLSRFQQASWFTLHRL